MNTTELLWAMLPEGLQNYYDFESFDKTENKFRIVLVEKNILPKQLPPEYQGKKVIDTSLNEKIIDDFPIRGRKGEIILKQRSWKFGGVDKWLTNKINLCVPGTKLEKEFADFLKEMDRD
jgi:hypothetical protein